MPLWIYVHGYGVSSPLHLHAIKSNSLRDVVGLPLVSLWIQSQNIHKHKEVLQLDVVLILNACDIHVLTNTMGTTTDSICVQRSKHMSVE